MEAVTQEGRRCTAKNRAGERCGKAPIKGGTVCVTHGGSAPQVRRKATLRLLELVDPAIGTLARAMVQADKSADRQRAANRLPDRAGMPPTATVLAGERARAPLVARLHATRRAGDPAPTTQPQK